MSKYNCCRSYEYNQGLKILLKHKKPSKHKHKFKGPYESGAIYDKRKTLFQKIKVKNVTNIRYIKPFIE